MIVSTWTLRRHRGATITAATIFQNYLQRSSSMWFGTTSTSSLDTTISMPWIVDGCYTYYSDNQFVRSETNEHAVINPATQQLLGVVPENTTNEIQRVIAKSKWAYESWHNVPVPNRQRIFFEFQKLILDHTDQLAALITLENGKTIADAKGDIHRGLQVVETACQVATHLLGDSLHGLASNHPLDTVSYRVPLGITVGICPFNFPVMIPLWMFPLSIACGNTMILKPSEKTPGASLLLADLLRQAGLPPNVLQIVHGSHDVVHALMTHPEPRAVSFVGSNIAGESIYHLASTHGKRAQCNLGAKNHAVVLLDDADRKPTISAIVGAAFGAAGQRCMALSVLILVGGTQSTRTSWIQDIVQQASQLKVGPGWHSDIDVGPLITSAAKIRVCEIVEKAQQQESSEILLDGRSVQVHGYEHGNFVGPTIIQVSSTDNIAYQTEIFGPVLTILAVDTIEDAIQIIRDNPYGNGCAIFTQSGSKARQFVRDVDCGQVGVNVPIPVPLPMFSFTGNKHSMRGDVNFYGASGVRFFTQLKTVTSLWAPTSSDLGGVNMPTFGSNNNNNNNNNNK
jgi:malonate-semialdehyde dehydrogenase (acetylating)/methylmalonate-semialdehyde dehydrogenase